MEKKLVMNGYTTKYYKYKNTSGKINISPVIAKLLAWNHGDEIKIVVKTIEGKQGLFLFKKENEAKNE
ncbi:MAG: hypothetical protein ACFFDF_23775 [Candidatus Odinarchaeota archaeon]